MAKGAELVLVVATLVFLLAAGDVDAQHDRTGEQVLAFYVPGPSKIIAGPGSGSTNLSESAFGTLAVYDGPIVEVFDKTSKYDAPVVQALANTSQYFGQGRGFFLVDNYAGTNILMFFTLDFTSHGHNGSVVISGTEDLLQPRIVVPILGGSGEFLYINGYAVLQPKPLEPTGAPGEILTSAYYTEMHYTLPRPNADIQAPSESPR